MEGTACSAVSTVPGKRLCFCENIHKRPDVVSGHVRTQFPLAHEQHSPIPARPVRSGGLAFPTFGNSAVDRPGRCMALNAVQCEHSGTATHEGCADLYSEGRISGRIITRRLCASGLQHFVGYRALCPPNLRRRPAAHSPRPIRTFRWRPGRPWSFLCPGRMAPRAAPGTPPGRRPGRNGCLPSRPFLTALRATHSVPSASA